MNRSIVLVLGACMTVSLGSVLAAEPSGSPPAAPGPPPAAPGPPPAGEYHSDKSHASFVLRANHMGFSTYTTRFSRFDAQLRFDPADLAASTVSATIEADSFAMDDAPQMCLDIMKGPNMLDTGKFPQIVFKSQQVRSTGAHTMEIAGTLTMRGITRPIVLQAKYNGGYAGVPAMDPHARIGFSAHGALKRSDFGMGFGVPPPGSNFGFGDEVDFSIEAEFTGPPLATTDKGAH